MEGVAGSPSCRPYCPALVPAPWSQDWHQLPVEDPSRQAGCARPWLPASLQLQPPQTGLGFALQGSLKTAGERFGDKSLHQGGQQGAAEVLATPSFLEKQQSSPMDREMPSATFL